MTKQLVTWAVLAMLAQGVAGCGGSDSSSIPLAPTPSTSRRPPTPPPRPLVDLTGNYRVTFEADSSCEQLPEVLRTRTYEASIGYIGAGPDGTRHYFRADLSGAHFDSYARFFIIRVIDTDVFFDFSDSLIVEEPEPGTYLTIIGGAGDATVDQSDLSRISTPFEGHFLYCVTDSEFAFPYSCPANAIASSACRSKNSRWTLTRR